MQKFIIHTIYSIYFVYFYYVLRLALTVLNPVIRRNEKRLNCIIWTELNSIELILKNVYICMNIHKNKETCLYLSKSSMNFKWLKSIIKIIKSELFLLLFRSVETFHLFCCENVYFQFQKVSRIHTHKHNDIARFWIRRNACSIK